MGVAYCAAFADGTLGAEEDERLEEHLAECRALKGVDEDALAAARRRVSEIASRDGDAALLAQASASLAPPLRETAFCLAADIVLADGEVQAEERAFLDRLRRALGVHDALASRIVEVVLIRNRG